MEYVCQSIALKLGQTEASVEVIAKQGDTARKLSICLQNDGVPYRIGADCYAVLTATKPDGSILYNHCDIEDNAIIYTFTEQTTAAVGRMLCEVKLYGPDDKLVNSSAFRMIVEGTIYGDDRIDSVDEVTALTHLVSETTSMLQDGKKEITYSQEILENAAQAVKDAQSALCDAETASAAANTAADRANAASAVAYEANEKVDTLREVVSKFHSNILEEASGEVITLSDASDLELAGLKVYGKTNQDGTPTPDAPVALENVGDGGSVTVTACGKNLLKNIATTQTLNGVTFTVNADGSVTANGTAGSSGTNLIIAGKAQLDPVLIPGENYILSGCPGGSGSVAGMQLWNYDGNGSAISENGNGCKFSRADDLENYNIAIVVSANATVSDMTFYPMIRAESVNDATYEPYKEPTTITVDTDREKSLYLPGIPVTDRGNYTDESGQQWICDEVDFEKGVYVQRVKKVVFDGSDDETWEARAVYESTASRWVIILSNIVSPVSTTDKPNILCNRFNPISANNTYIANEGIALQIWGSSSAVIIYDQECAEADVTAWKAYLAEKNVTVYCVLKSPIEYALTAEELAQYAALHTNYPNTTVCNDTGAHMEVKYVADTKLYVDKKFSELAQALVSST